MNKRKKKDQFAEVIHTHGRWMLRVGGLIVAMETDPCRDSRLTGDFWTKDNLDDAAVHINIGWRDDCELAVINHRLATGDYTQ